MPIHIVCAGCGAAYNVADELQGKKVRCRQCDKPIGVTATAPPKAPPRKVEAVEERTQPAPRKAVPPPRVRAERDDRDAVERRPRRQPEYDDEDRPARRRSARDDADAEGPRRRKTQRKAKQAGAAPWIIGAVVVSVLVLGVAAIALGAVRFWSQPSKQEQAQLPGQNLPLPFDRGGPLQGGPGGFQGGGPPILVVEGGGKDNDVQLSPEVIKKIKPATVHVQVKNVGEGSGFLAFEPGVVLTNAHVVGMLEPGTERPEGVVVHVHHGETNEKELVGHVVGVDRSSDLAVLRVDPADLPLPLEVKSAGELLETQAVYVCGYPYGDELGKNVTITQGQVTALRKERGELKKVQLKSDMKPGNSGGPVVDAKGDVVGVSVSGIVGTRINFAVPGNYVHTIVRGRLSSMAIGQSYLHPDGVMIPVTMELINPVGRITKAGIEIWTGDQKQPPPPPSTAPPQLRPGDSSRQRRVFVLRQDTARGDVPSPALPPGKDYWIQPFVEYGDGVTQWSGAATYTADIPVERKAVRLFYRNIQGNREVVLNSKTSLRLGDRKGDDHAVQFNMDTVLLESTGPANRFTGAAAVTLQSRACPPA